MTHETCNIPRIIISAPASSQGKTVVTCALLRALSRRELHVHAAKSGPDYIDPMFHRAVLGVPSMNLDMFFCSEEQIRSEVANETHDADLLVIEGAMGYYDGLGIQSTQASAYHVARTLGAPCILVVDARGAALSVAATILGFAHFKSDAHVAGVILNRCSTHVTKMLAPAIEQETGVRVLGAIPQNPVMELESRHLGLICADEIPELDTAIDAMADLVAKSIDLDVVIDIAQSAEPFSFKPLEDARSLVLAGRKKEFSPVIAVANDEAFCFYYPEALKTLERAGSQLCMFSPIHDAEIPPQADALYLGGGYPELHARVLAKNTSMLASVRHAYASKMPIFAECGGYLYLMKQLIDTDRVPHELTGILPGTARFTGKLHHFGYINLRAQDQGMLLDAGESVRAHEYHYYRIDDEQDEGGSFIATKPTSKRSWCGGVQTDRLFAGFPHLYLPAYPKVASRFVQAARTYVCEQGRYV